MSDQEPDESPSSVPESQTRLVPVRRRPNIVAFVLTGVVLGVIAAVIITATSAGDGSYSSATTFGYFAVILGGLGGLIGGLIGALLDRRADR